MKMRLLRRDLQLRICIRIPHVGVSVDRKKNEGIQHSLIFKLRYLQNLITKPLHVALPA